MTTPKKTPARKSPATKPAPQGRPRAGRPISVLREALSGPFPAMREQALAIIQDAMTEPTIADACRKLDVLRQPFDRLRGDFPEIDKLAV